MSPMALKIKKMGVIIKFIQITNYGSDFFYHCYKKRNA